MLVQQEITKAIHAAAKELIIEMELQDIEAKLLALPTAIDDTHSAILNRQRDIEPLKHSVEERKAEAENIKAIIEAEVTMDYLDGKPRFSNDKLRNAETARRLIVNEEYQSARGRQQGFEEEISSISLDISMLRNEASKLESQMANYRVILSARAAQINAIFGGSV